VLLFLPSSFRFLAAVAARAATVEGALGLNAFNAKG